MRRKIGFALAVVGVPVLACVGWIGSIGAQMPTPQGPRVEGPAGLIGVETGGSYAWIVPVDGGAVLVDAGLDPAAQAIKSVLAERGLGADDVLAVFVTHGHVDHTLGLAAFPTAQVWIGPGEGPLVRGEVEAARLIPRIFGVLVGGAPAAPAKLAEVVDGDALEVGGASFRMIHVPGHTGGSLMVQWREVLFTGDSLVGMGDGVAMLPASFADDLGSNRASLFKVAGLRFTTVADGHSGLVPDANTKLFAFLQ